MPVSAYGLRGSDGILWPLGRTPFGTRSINRVQANLRAANLPVFNLVEREIVPAPGRFEGASHIRGIRARLKVRPFPILSLRAARCATLLHAQPSRTSFSARVIR